MCVCVCTISDVFRRLPKLWLYEEKLRISEIFIWIRAEIVSVGDQHAVTITAAGVKRLSEVMC